MFIFIIKIIDFKIIPIFHVHSSYAASFFNFKVTASVAQFLNVTAIAGGNSRKEYFKFNCKSIAGRGCTIDFFLKLTIDYLAECEFTLSFLQSVKQLPLQTKAVFYNTLQKYLLKCPLKFTFKYP